MSQLRFVSVGVAGCILGFMALSGDLTMAQDKSSNATVLLDEQFNGPQSDSRLHWLNPPPSSEVRNGWLEVAPGNETDFWQKTLDGGSRANGPVFCVELSGDFVAETRVTGDYYNLYDQAGLMLWKDAMHWVKADAENDPIGSPTLGVVVTRDTSDWSVSRLAPKVFMLRLERKGNLVAVYASEDGKNWPVLRMTILEWKNPLQVGIFAACPTKPGMHARFDYLKITRPAK